MSDAINAVLCWRLTTDTGTILELWELDNGQFEFLTAEAHKPDEVVGAVTLTLVEAELLSEKITMATSAARADTERAETALRDMIALDINKDPLGETS